MWSFYRKDDSFGNGIIKLFFLGILRNSQMQIQIVLQGGAHKHPRAALLITFK